MPLWSLHLRKFIKKVALHNSCICNVSTLRTRTSNRPPHFFAHQFHGCSLPPPLIDFAWQSEPQFSMLAHVREIAQQFEVNITLPTASDVVGIHQEADQSVRSQDLSNLLSP